MSDAFAANPASAARTAEILAKLRRGHPYERGLVDAVFQNWDRFPITMTDAYAFTLVYGAILLGELRIARVPVGRGPGSDRDVVGNNERLAAGLPPQFSAEFWGGAGDHDGHFRWHDHAHLGGYINVNGKLVDGPEVVVGPCEMSLEVGYQSASKTEVMIRQQGAIARWPYGSEDVWVILNTEIGQIGNPGCVRDEDGWPCSRTRGAAAP